LERKNEGLNFFYKIIGLSLLRYMQRHASINYKKTLSKIQEVLQKTNVNLAKIDEDKNCLPIRKLEQMGLYKRKYPIYAAYLAAISSYPMLYKVGDEDDLTASIFAKTASILSIKVLDNTNDTLHDYDQAVQSLIKHEEALVDENSTYNSSNELIAKAENSTYLMARWTYDTLRKYVDDHQYSFRLYKDDIRNYMAGQRYSFYQKMFNRDNPQSISLNEYLAKVTNKGIGSIWFDIDLCVYEKKYGPPTGDHIKLIQHVKRSMEHLHKSTLFYDDASDLRSDIEEKIVNSVVLYGVEQGYCSVEDVEKDPNGLVRKLEKTRALRDIIHLGDLIFSKGIYHLHKAEEFSDGTIDIEALKLNLGILRAFAMRKWIIEQKNLECIKASLRSFYKLEKIFNSIPAHILSYENALI